VKGIVGQLAVSVARTGAPRPTPGARRGTTPSPASKVWSTSHPRRGAAVSYVVPRRAGAR